MIRILNILELMCISVFGDVHTYCNSRTRYLIGNIHYLKYITILRKIGTSICVAN
jgi:hypothetical protein